MLSLLQTLKRHTLQAVSLPLQQKIFLIFELIENILSYIISIISGRKAEKFYKANGNKSPHTLHPYSQGGRFTECIY
jgi:hypothetical protein